jgi:hypothetical protein
MKKFFVFITIFFLFGLCFYGKSIKFSRAVFFFSAKNEISFKNPFKKQTQIPIQKKEIDEKILSVSPSNGDLIKKPVKISS